MVKTKKVLSLIVAITMILSLTPIMMVGAAGDYDTIIAETAVGDDTDSMAFHMDKPLYEAISDTCFSGADFTVAQAKARTAMLSLANKNISGTLRGIEMFGKVSYIHINGNQLTGEIPDISTLVTLKGLRLNSNQLTGEIPDFSASTGLVELCLDINQFTGEIPDISQNLDLSTFRVNDNQLTGEIPNLSDNVNLTVFRVWNNALTGSLPDLSQNVALTDFRAGNNKFTGEIPDLSNNVELVNFQTYNNALTGSIPDLSQNVNLSVLQIYDNTLTGEIPNLSQNVALTDFRVGNNQLTGEIPNLSNNVNLSVFQAHNNALTGSIPDLSDNTALSTFNVRANALTGEIPDISQNVALTDFRADANQLTGEIPNLSQNVNLKIFQMHTNRLTGTIPDISNNTALTLFNVNANALTGPIPDISNNIELATFYVHTNVLTGSLPDLSNNVNLVNFQAYNNSLTGEIPDISNNVNLVNFQINNNALTGSIPDLSNNTLLVSVQLHYNHLTGTIPDLSNNIALKTFTLSDNYVDGSIPDLSNNINLEIFHVNNNCLTGAVPNFSNNPNLTSVLLDNNRLTGSIPALTNNTKLQRFAVSGNQLTGTVPDLSVSSDWNRVINFSGNKDLAGTIPAGLALDFATVWGSEINDGDRPINIVSSIYKYSTTLPQDGTPMVMNQDIDNDGIPEFNLMLTTLPTGVLGSNIDVNGDGKADININVDFSGFPEFNLSAFVSSATGDFIGFIPQDMKINPVYAPITASMFKIGPAPYYLVPADGQPSDLLVPNVKTVLVPGSNPEVYVDVLLPTAKPNVPLELNKDTDGDGNPDENIDINGDGIPDLNIVNNYQFGEITGGTDANGFPEVEYINTTPKNPIQSTDPNGLNYIHPNGTIPDDIYNIDINGDGVADYNVLPNPTTTGEFDTDGRYTGDVSKIVDFVPKGGTRPQDLYNADTDGDGVADYNILPSPTTEGDAFVGTEYKGGNVSDIANYVHPNNKNNDGSPKNPEYVYNVDTDEDGIADENTLHNPTYEDRDFDEDGQYIVDLSNVINYLPEGGVAPDDLYNIDVDGDGVADYNILPVGTNEDKFVNGKYNNGDVSGVANYVHKNNRDEDNKPINPNYVYNVEIDGQIYNTLPIPAYVNGNFDAEGKYVGAGTVGNPIELSIDGDGKIIVKPDALYPEGSYDVDIDEDGEADYNILPEGVTGDDFTDGRYTGDLSNVINYLPEGGVYPDDLYNIDIDGDGIPDYNVLPSPTYENPDFAGGSYKNNDISDLKNYVHKNNRDEDNKPINPDYIYNVEIDGQIYNTLPIPAYVNSNFDAEGKYVGAGVIGNPVKLSIDEDGKVTLKSKGNENDKVDLANSGIMGTRGSAFSAQLGAGYTRIKIKADYAGAEPYKATYVDGAQTVELFWSVERNCYDGLIQNSTDTIEEINAKIVWDKEAESKKIIRYGNVNNLGGAGALGGANTIINGLDAVAIQLFIEGNVTNNPDRVMLELLVCDVNASNNINGLDAVAIQMLAEGKSTAFTILGR